MRIHSRVDVDEIQLFRAEQFCASADQRSTEGRCSRSRFVRIDIAHRNEVDVLVSKIFPGTDMILSEDSASARGAEIRTVIASSRFDMRRDANSPRQGDLTPPRRHSA
jgi:hypothetical protein